MKRALYIANGVLLSLSVHAGSTDPVAWNLLPQAGFPTTQVGSSSSSTYTLTSHHFLPVRLNTAIAIEGTGLTAQDNCNNITLQPGGQCTVVVTFSPLNASTSTFQLTYGYDNNRIPLPKLSAVGSGSQTGFGLSGAIANFAPTIVASGTSPTFTGLFTNIGTNTLTNCHAGNANGNAQFTLTPSSAATLNYNPASNTCGTLANKVTLTPGQGCDITGTISSPYQLGPVSLSALVSCDEASSAPSVNSTIVASAPNLTGTINYPSPFPTVFYTNQSPYIRAHFKNTGNVALSGCYAGTGGVTTPFELNPGSAATIGNNVPQTNTCGTSASPINLAPGATCDTYAQLTSLAAPNSFILTGHLTCSGASSAPVQSSSIQAPSGACTTLTPSVILQLPTTTYVYADNVVQFEYTNSCALDSIALGPVTLSATAGTATITTNNARDLCSNRTLTPGQSCTVTASIIPSSPAASPLTIQASVTPGGGAATPISTTATTVLSNQQATHHIVFVNQCNFDVWYGIANGDGSGCPGTTCKTPDPNMTTPAGALPSAYHLPALVAGAAPSTIDLLLTSYQNGAFWPRTGCAIDVNGQFNCATGTCATITNSATCLAPPNSLNQPQPPYTKFEATINAAPGTDGVYDTSVINGMNVPVEVKAFGPSTGNTASTVYNCTPAGAIIQPQVGNPPSLVNPLGECSWRFDPSSTLTAIPNVNNDFYWVTAGADNACASAPVPSPSCGMANSISPSQTNPGGGATINRRNGNFLAISALTNFIGYTATTQWGSSNLYTKYGMGLPIPNATTYPYTSLLGCVYDSGTGNFNSCYQVNANFDQCCGCVNWTNTLPSEQCGNGAPGYQGENEYWNTLVVQNAPASYTIQNAITWLKDACPTAYAYQFDDPSSSFQCTDDGGTALFTSYQVTFCPGGETGLPAGATEGRGTHP